MQCPQDGQTLAMTTREGIEIDYCPSCRGVWLDRGELDKIIERSASQPAAAAPPPPPQQQSGSPPQPGYVQQSGYGEYQDRKKYDHDYHGGYKKKRRGFLGDIFDFD